MRKGTGAIVDRFYGGWDRHDAEESASSSATGGMSVQVESSTAATSGQADEADTRAGS